MNKKSSQIQILIFLVPVCFGTWAAIILPRFEIFGSIIFTIGILAFITLVYAKLSEKKRTGKMISWGHSSMNKKEQIMYLGGYTILLLSVAALVIYKSGIFK